MQIEGFGISGSLPDGWHGRIYTNDTGTDAARSSNIQIATVPISATDDDICTATSQLIGLNGVIIMLYETPYFPWLDADYESVSGPPVLRPSDAQSGWEGMNPFQFIFVRRVKVADRYFQVRAIFGSKPDFAKLGAVNGILGALKIGAPLSV